MFDLITLKTLHAQSEIARTAAAEMTPVLASFAEQHRQVFAGRAEREAAIAAATDRTMSDHRNSDFLAPSL